MKPVSRRDIDPNQIADSGSQGSSRSVWLRFHMFLFRMRVVAMQPGANSQSWKARRATTEDLPALTRLWTLMRLPGQDLAKRVTEFQVVEDASGTLIGAVGLEIAARQGRLHSEGFTDFALADAARPLLWSRVIALANNHGLLNLWTQEQAPFWKQSGFAEPQGDLSRKFPLEWRACAGKWLALKLREDIEAVLSMDQEFAVFMQAEKERTQRAIRRAKALKSMATLIAAGLFVAVVIAGWYLVRQRSLGR